MPRSFEKAVSCVWRRFYIEDSLFTSGYCCRGTGVCIYVQKKRKPFSLAGKIGAFDPIGQERWEPGRRPYLMSERQVAIVQWRSIGVW